MGGSEFFLKKILKNSVSKCTLSKKIDSTWRECLTHRCVETTLYSKLFPRKINNRESNGKSVRERSEFLLGLEVACECR
jgi:hypothetical protein